MSITSNSFVFLRAIQKHKQYTTIVNIKKNEKGE